jgi:DNA-binding response OmpR family regulator
LRYAFQRDGYKVVMAFDGEMAVRTFESEAPDIVVLDLMMPRRTGMEALKEIRARSRVPVIILSALGDEERVVSALEMGADDFLIKPFRPRELRARTRALLRRAEEHRSSESHSAKPIALGDLSLDPRTRQVMRSGEVIRLSAKEFSLLHYLMVNHDIVLSASEIISNVWSFDGGEGDEIVKVTIHRLRQKIEPDRTHPTYICNVPGHGYCFQYKQTAGR